MDARAKPATVQVRTALWLLPIGFIVHDGEELWTMARWIERHQAQLARIAAAGPFARRIVETVPSTNSEIAITMAIELVVLVAVTAIAARRPGSRTPMYVYAGLFGAFAAHAVTHLLLAIGFGGYVPGVVTAVFIIPATSVIVYRRLFAAGMLTWRSAVAATLVGIVAIGPLFAAAVGLARRLAGS